MGAHAHRPATAMQCREVSSSAERVLKEGICCMLAALREDSHAKITVLKMGAKCVPKGVAVSMSDARHADIRET